MGSEEGEGSHLPRAHRAPGGRREVQRFLKEFGLSADKRLGQHFLASERVVGHILERVADASSVLEIGPGIGVLTAPLCDAVSSVVAVELDKRFIEVLSAVAPRAEVLQADVLTIDLAGLLVALPEHRCIVSNMPYNITGPLLEKVSECRPLIRNAVLMMQKEVGERVLAPERSSERGALSVAMQLQFRIEKVCDAKAGVFVPPPRIDSVVLDLVPQDTLVSLDRVLEVVRTGFRQPRKTLANNLSAKYDRSKIALPEKVRPHELTNDDWIALAERL